ncbi:hypothetical protein V8D89_007145 [Ganoderma adspersum]
MSDVRASAARTLVLTNSDLLDSVFLSLWLDYPERFNLVRCATVCRGFHEPAIRLLWNKLDSFFPLWHLLAPPNTKCPKEYSFNEDKRPDYLHQVISLRLYDDPAVWERFLWHASRVRHIAHCARSSDSPETNAAQLILMQAVLMKNGGETVLPLLQSIRWEADVPTDSSLVSFFTSTLRCTTFTLKPGPDDEEAHALLFRRLRETSPYLQKIKIDSTYSRIKDAVVVGPRLVQELLSFDQLRELRVYHRLSQPEIFLDLVSKPNLTSLGIEDLAGPLGSPSAPILVRDLLELSIEGAGPTLVGLFNLLRFEALESATINIKDSRLVEQETKDVLKAFHNALPSPSTLRSLTLRIGSDSGTELEDTAIALRDLIRPILPLRELRSFAFHSRELCPRIEVVDIATLAGAWPGLERLTLYATPPSDSEAFSLDALHYIHAHCPRLQELQTQTVRLPVLGVHAIPAPLDRAPPHHALRRLWTSGVYAYRSEYEAGRIVTEHAEAFARYFLELFPAVDVGEYRRWVPRSGVRTKSAPRRYNDGREVLVAMYQYSRGEPYTSRAPNAVYPGFFVRG